MTEITVCISTGCDEMTDDVSQMCPKHKRGHERRCAALKAREESKARQLGLPYKTEEERHG